MKGIANQPEVNQMNIFQNKEFGQVRTVTIDGEPWFVGKDVAAALGYSEPQKAIREHVESDDKMGVRNGQSPTGVESQNATPYIIDDMGRKQFPVWINESGLYALIFGSKLESAKKFKHWVTSEVLPAIRKNGAYIPEGVMNQLALLQKAIMDVTKCLTAITERVNDNTERIDDITRRLEALEASRKEPPTLDEIFETTTDVNCPSYDEWIKDNHLTREKISAHPTTVVYESYVKYYSGNKLVGVGKKTFYKKLQKDFGFTKRKQKSDGKRYFI